MWCLRRIRPPRRLAVRWAAEGERTGRGSGSAELVWPAGSTCSPSGRSRPRCFGASIPHYMSPCWYTLDPASLLITSHYQRGRSRSSRRSASSYEYLRRRRQQAHRRRPLRARHLQTLHEATGGDPSTSQRWHANMEMGGDQELIAALRTQGGDRLGRPGSIPRARPAAVRPRRNRVSSARSLLTLPMALAPGSSSVRPRTLSGPTRLGSWCCPRSGEVESATPGVERWLADLPDGDWEAGGHPVLRPGGRVPGAADDGRPGRPRRDRDGARARRFGHPGSSCTARRLSPTASGGPP